MRVDNYRGAKSVFGWSFYRSGSTAGSVSADLFVTKALEFLDGSTSHRSTSLSRCERLAQLLQRDRHLLLLDGLEVLQWQQTPSPGSLRDRAMALLLEELAVDNPGLCVVTSRIPVDLPGDSGEVIHVPLEGIRPDAGRALLTSLRVRGSDADLRRVAGTCAYHALSIKLLGAYLYERSPDHGLKSVEEIGLGAEPDQPRSKATRILDAFRGSVLNDTEIELLRVIGIAGRPIHEASIMSLAKAARIPGLTERLNLLTLSGLTDMIRRLRALNLFYDQSRDRPTEVDTHPIIREYFDHSIRAEDLAAWRAGHAGLYRHFCQAASDLPIGLDEMQPLSFAVEHGCKAGLHSAACYEVFQRRMCRHQNAYIVKELGAIDETLATLSWFFTRQWDVPAEELDDGAADFVVHSVAYCLRASGRLLEATGAFKSAFKNITPKGDSSRAGTCANNLSQTLMVMGDLDAAERYSRIAIDLGERNAKRGNLQPVWDRTLLAYVLLHRGKWREVEQPLQEALALQARIQPELPFLYAHQGFRFWSYFFDRGENEAMRPHVTRAIQGVSKTPFGESLEVLAAAMACIPGRGATNAESLDGSESLFDRAVDGLIGVGMEHELPLALLARAKMKRLTGSVSASRRDADRALRLSRRAGMRLHEIDALLEGARIALEEDESEIASRHVASCRELVERVAYDRRKLDLLLLDARLAFLAGRSGYAIEKLLEARRLVEEHKLHSHDLEIYRLGGSLDGLFGGSSVRLPFS